MDTMEEYINAINTKLQVLLKKYAVLQKENTNLINEIELCKQNEKDHLPEIILQKQTVYSTLELDEIISPSLLPLFKTQYRNNKIRTDLDANRPDS